MRITKEELRAGRRSLAARHARSRRLQSTPPRPRPAAPFPFGSQRGMCPGVGKTASFEPRGSSHPHRDLDSSPHQRQMGTFPAGSQVGTGAVRVGVPSGDSSALRPNGARRGGSQYGPPRCTSAQPFLQTLRPVGFRRAAAENCRPAIFEARAPLREQRESAVGRRPATLKSVPVC